MVPAGSTAVVLAATGAAATGDFAVAAAAGTAAAVAGTGAGAVTSGAAGWWNSCPADAGLAA